MDTSSGDKRIMVGRVNGETIFGIISKKEETYSILQTGQAVNVNIKKLVSSSAKYSTTDSTITAIVQSDEAPESVSGLTNISSEGKPVYVWLEDTTVKYYSAANTIYLNEDSSYLLYEYRGLTNIDGLTNLNTSKVTNMSNMFYCCTKLESLDAISDWNTSNVTNMSATFKACNSITVLDPIAGWDVSNVTNMANMFYPCKKLTSLDPITGWDTSNVTTMNYMFGSCETLTSVNLSKWNVKKVTTIVNMFKDCSALTSVDLSAWSTDSLAGVAGIFQNCSKLTSVNVSGDGWNTSKVTNANLLFYNCYSLKTLDLSSWDLINVTTSTAASSLQYCTALQTMYCHSVWESEFLFPKSSGCPTTITFVVGAPTAA